MRVDECILFLSLFFGACRSSKRFHIKNHAFITRFACTLWQTLRRGGRIKSSDGKLLYFIDDPSTIQDKAKPLLVFYTEDRCMEVCKNKASGKYFLFIEETNDGKLLLVIPNGEIKELDSSLFEDVEELDIEYCLNTGLIVSQQIDGYKKFVEKEPIWPHKKT